MSPILSLSLEAKKKHKKRLLFYINFDFLKYTNELILVCTFDIMSCNFASDERRLSTFDLLLVVCPLNLVGETFEYVQSRCL